LDHPLSLKSPRRREIRLQHIFGNNLPVVRTMLTRQDRFLRSGET
jgi:hypothetical protein